MKQLFFILLLTTLLVLTACSTEEQALNETIQDTISNIEETNETIIVEEPIIEEPPKEELVLEENTLETPQEPLGVKLPAEQTLELNNIGIEKTQYGETEEHELTVIIGASQYQNIKDAILTFTANCKEENHLLVTLNKEVLYQKTLPCKKQINLGVSKDILIEGPNRFILKTDIEEAFDMTNIALIYNYNDGTTENLPAADKIFEPASSTNKKIKTLDKVLLTNTIEQTFKLSKEELTNELYLTLEKQEGKKLIVLLNDKAIYEGEPDEEEIILPRSFLKEGTNTVTFVME